MQKYVAFDLEISKEISPNTDDWKALRPLGISCAATLTSDNESVEWVGKLDDGYASKMTALECQHLAHYLCEKNTQGYIPLTFNGLGFDFDILAEECQTLEWFDNCRELALTHIDIFFAMFCAKGYAVGLNTACKGMGLTGKTEGMHGAKAPTMWAQGREQQEQVLEYVRQDVRATADLYEAILKKRQLDWVSRSGNPNSWYPAMQLTEKTRSGWNARLLKVNEALVSHEPDTSWMSDPWPRSKFYAWTGWEAG